MSRCGKDILGVSPGLGQGGAPPGASGLPTLSGFGAGLGSALSPLLSSPTCAGSVWDQVRMLWGLGGFGDVEGCMFQTPWGSPELQRRDHNLPGTLPVNKSNHISFKPWAELAKTLRRAPQSRATTFFPHITLELKRGAVQGHACPMASHALCCAGDGDRQWGVGRDGKGWNGTGRDVMGQAARLVMLPGPAARGSGAGGTSITGSRNK